MSDITIDLDSAEAQKLDLSSVQALQSSVVSEMKKMSQRKIEKIQEQGDGFYTVIFKEADGETETTIQDAYRYKPKQESTRDLLSLGFPVDDNGYVYLPKNYPTDKTFSDKARESLYLLDTQSYSDLVTLNEEQKDKLIAEMPKDYYPDVLPCDPADLCQASVTQSAPAPTTPEEPVSTPAPVPKKEEEEEEEEEETDLTWLWILLSVIGVGVLVFLIYYLLIRRRTTFV